VSKVKIGSVISVLCLVFSMAIPASAHFGMLIPDTDEVTQEKRSVELTLSFSHPFEMEGMDLEKPSRFFVVENGGKPADLRASLKSLKVMGHQGWKAGFKPKHPGLYTFVFDPVPYKEDAENNYIRHITKVVVDAYGEGEEWHTPLGLDTEIVPLTRPFGNYAGNVFQGVVMLEGKPAPYTRVEVEFYNKDGKYQAPNDRMITQEIMADERGVFTFTCPWKGWWGFAGLNAAKAPYKGRELELGAVIWVEMK